MAPRILPVQPEQPDRHHTAEEWEQAAPTIGDRPMLHGPSTGTVTQSRSGPGDSGYADQWLNPNIADVPHEGIENGRQLFALIPGPPPEGHGGYDIPDQDAITDRSTTRQALFWSDWNGSTALQAGGRGSFTGEHVVIMRIPPGSTQGYMPSDPGMVQPNNDRALPQPWDSDIILGVPQVS